MTPLGIGIVGTGNIAGGYARDTLTHPEIRLVAATDLDPGPRDRVRRGARLPGPRLARRPPRRRRGRHRRQPDRPPRPLRGHEAGPRGRPHVYSEKPLALRSERGRASSSSSPRRAACASGARRRRSSARRSRPRRRRSGPAASGPSGRSTPRSTGAGSRRWHPAPAPFFDVGVLVDVGVYPLTLVTTMLGPARRSGHGAGTSSRNADALDGTPFRIGSPDLIVAAIELEGGAVVRLTASFYVGRPAKLTGSIEFHGDDASLALGNFQDFDATVEVGPYGETYEPVALVRPGSAARPGRAAWRRWPRRSPRAGRTAPAPNRPPTSSTSSRRPASPWPRTDEP